MSTWSFISNTSSIVQLLGAGTNVIQFLLARTNLTGAERTRTQRLRDGRLLALELISCSQRGTPIPPACFSRLEQYCLDALASHQAYGARTLGADIWRGSPDSIMLANLENQQLMILEVLADLIRAKDDVTSIRQSNAHNTQVITEKLSIIEGNTNHQNRFINWPAVAAEHLQLPDESRGSLQKPSTCKKPSITPRQRQQRTIQKKVRGRYICLCICHNVIKVGGRQWHIKIQDPRNLYTCTCSCASFTVESWFGSSKFRNAFALDLFVAWRDGMTISPTIRVAQVVPFTSPGFAVAKKLSRGIVTLERAKAELHQLFVERKASPLDVDPNNQSLFQAIFPLVISGEDLDILSLWAESGALSSSDLQIMCFESLPRRRPSSQLNRILNQLLVYGFDLIHAQLNPRLLSSSQSISFYDPFLLEILTCYAMEDPYFDDMTCFQIAVLTQQPPDILKSLATNPDLHCLNSLGQTVLHLAVLRPSALSLLLQNGGQDMVNRGDINGTTPLAYAVIYGIADSVRLLLRNGAKIYNAVTIQDDPDPCDGFSYSVCYGSERWVDSPVTEAILSHWISDWVLESGDQVTDPLRACRIPPVQQFMDKLFIGNPCSGLPRFWSPYNLKFVHEGLLCALSNLTSITRMETDWLYNSGLFMRVYTLAMHFDCTVLQHALQTANPQKTATLSNVEVLKHLRAHEIRAWSGGNLRQDMGTWFYLGTVFKLHMRANLSISPCNVCRCECGTNGCSILTEIACTFDRERNFRSSDMRLDGVSLLLEWFLSLQASQSLDDLHKACQDLFRLQRFEELGIRHVCRVVHGGKAECWSGKRWINITSARGNEIDLEDIEEIMDEDFPLIEQLENDCYKFEQEGIPDAEQAWIALLARRWVFLEAPWMSPQIVQGAEVEQTIATWESKSNSNPCIKLFKTKTEAFLIDEERDKFDIREIRNVQDYWYARSFDLFLGHYQYYAERPKDDATEQLMGNRDFHWWTTTRKEMIKKLRNKIGELRQKSLRDWDWDTTSWTSNSNLD